jgi:hypothetical protein
MSGPTENAAINRIYVTLDPSHGGTIAAEMQSSLAPPFIRDPSK